MNILFFCSPAEVINGGTRQVFAMAELLAQAGLPAKILERQSLRPTWFSSTIPIVGMDAFVPDPESFMVIPEDQPQLLEAIKNFPQKKVVYAQGLFYSSLGIDRVDSLEPFGIKDIICSSRSIYQHVQKRHPECTAHLVPCGVDRSLFKPLAKRKEIAFLPRKRVVEALYIQQMFRYLHPECRDIDWVEINRRSEADTARLMGEAAVFLALGRLEGLGLTPLEAMSAGCVVAGFTGIGGWEYANDQNGFWANEDDFPTCLAQLKRAVDLAAQGPQGLGKYNESCDETLAFYSKEMFARTTIEAWQKIIGR